MDEFVYIGELGLKEVKEQYDQAVSSSRVITDKANSFLSSSSLIFALLTILQLDFIEPDQPAVYQVGLIFVFISFFGMIACILFSLWPREYPTPFLMTRDGIMKTILGFKSIEDAISQLTGTYMDRFYEYKKITDRRACALKIAQLLFAVIVLVLVGLWLFVAKWT